ncbi:heme oxygenase-like [Sesbania bispinosa]|nr:heme oxygenase-like [Sesbania bispinosa]
MFTHNAVPRSRSQAQQLRQRLCSSSQAQQLQLLSFASKTRRCSTGPAPSFVRARHAVRRGSSAIAMLLTAKPIQQLCFPATAPPNWRLSTPTTIKMNMRIVLTKANASPPLLKKRNRYRKLYPGESTGITEEMRFVAMKLRNNNSVTAPPNTSSQNAEDDTWQPSMEGFLRFLVDNELVFSTLERIVDESENVSYAHMRKTGLERSEGLSKDLEWFKEQAAGQVVAKKVSERLLEGKELEFYRWEGDVPEMLRSVREKLNMLAEHWSRDEKNKCLRETTKSFRYMGQIVRLIIL